MHGRKSGLAQRRPNRVFFARRHNPRGLPSAGQYANAAADGCSVAKDCCAAGAGDGANSVIDSCRSGNYTAGPSDGTTDARIRCLAANRSAGRRHYDSAADDARPGTTAEHGPNASDDAAIVAIACSSLGLANALTTVGRDSIGAGATASGYVDEYRAAVEHVDESSVSVGFIAAAGQPTVIIAN